MFWHCLSVLISNTWRILGAERSIASLELEKPRGPLYSKTLEGLEEPRGP